MKRDKIKSLEFKDLSYRINNETTVFDNISFALPESGICWVKSEAGEGKSSLLRILDGLVEPTKGDYLVNGKSVNDMSFDEFNLFRLNIGYSFDFGGMISNKSLYDNLHLPLEYHNCMSSIEADDRIQGVLELFGIQKQAHMRPSAVTGSIRKAMCVARAFIHNPQVILLDDPTTGLRGEVKSKFNIIVKNQMILYPNSLILIATEDEEFVQPLQDYCIHVQQKEVTVTSEKERAA